MTCMEESIASNLTIVSHPQHSRTSLKDSVRDGLMVASPIQKRLSCEFFYDHVGSDLFEKITELEEYYVTRTELSILTQRADEIAKNIGEDAVLIEFGSGSSSKTKTLLEAFIKNYGAVHYVPIDISRSILVHSSIELTKIYGDKIRITANHGSYQQGISYMHTHFADKPKLVMFLGSSIGNFSRADAGDFLAQIRTEMDPTDKFLLGVDLRKDKRILELAYNDLKGVTAEFNLNLLVRINDELGGHFDLSKFEHTAIYDENDGYIRMFLISKIDQSVRIDALDTDIQFKAGEYIHTENSVKYSKLEIDNLSYKGGFSIDHFWTDSNDLFASILFSPSSPKLPEHYLFVLRNAWEFSDSIFSLLQETAFFQQPIQLRHPFIFYLGHLPAFANNQIQRDVLQLESFNSYFDEIFERGIDPDVETLKCHDHSVVPSKWPTIPEILEYRKTMRKLAENSISQILENKDDVMAIKGRVFHMVAEHDYMHGETLLYMYQNLDTKFKKIPNVKYIISNDTAVTKKSIHIPEGYAILGTDFHKIEFGWDNEFNETRVKVPAFSIDEFPVTIGEYLKFVRSGEYNNPRNWSEKAWRWKQTIQLEHPHFWKLVDNKFYFQTIFGDLIELEKVANWPVYVSQAEASAYAKWLGKSLPTEAQWMRAAYGDFLKPFPWGNETPKPGIHGNFHFFSYAPVPVNSFPMGTSSYGVQDLVGNGWEWTCTPFDGLKGYSAYIKSYPGYSKDFFDGQHYVMLGASFATAAPLVRRSFRNWFQDVYQYTFSKFRCALVMEQSK